MALVTELGTASGKTFERRYAPYYEAEQLEQAKYLVMTTRERNQVAARTVERSDLTLIVAMQQALPDIEDKTRGFHRADRLAGCANERVRRDQGIVSTWWSTAKQASRWLRIQIDDQRSGVCP